MGKKTEVNNINNDKSYNVLQCDFLNVSGVLKRCGTTFDHNGFTFCSQVKRNLVQMKKKNSLFFSHQGDQSNWKCYSVTIHDHWKARTKT